jgi:hypothetical protein
VQGAAVRHIRFVRCVMVVGLCHHSSTAWVMPALLTLCSATARDSMAASRLVLC